MVWPDASKRMKANATVIEIAFVGFIAVGVRLELRLCHKTSREQIRNSSDKVVGWSARLLPITFDYLRLPKTGCATCTPRIFAKGDPARITKGNETQPKTTENVIRDDFLRTGDCMAGGGNSHKKCTRTH